MSKTPTLDGRICIIIHGDSREKLSAFENSIDLIVTSPPYADARKKHYDSIHPNDFPDWLATFHNVCWNALKSDGSLVINIKDKIVDGVRSHFVWKTIEKLEAKGWHCIDDYIWCKTNPMPGFWPTRLRDGWEYCFHLAKTKRPYINQDAVRVPIGDWVGSRLQKLGAGDLQPESCTKRAHYSSVANLVFENFAAHHTKFTSLQTGEELFSQSGRS